MYTYIFSHDKLMRVNTKPCQHLTNAECLFPKTCTQKDACAQTRKQRQTKNFTTDCALPIPFQKHSRRMPLQDIYVVYWNRTFSKNGRCARFHNYFSERFCKII